MRNFLPFEKKEICGQIPRLFQMQLAILLEEINASLLLTLTQVIQQLRSRSPKSKVTIVEVEKVPLKNANTYQVISKMHYLM